MEPPVLVDPMRAPADEVVCAHLGKRRALWEALFRDIGAEHPDYDAGVRG